MKNPSVAEVKSFVRKLWEQEVSDQRDLEVEVRRSRDEYEIKISQMYAYVPLHFALLFQLAMFFDTKNINDDRYSRRGCETCDYGSSYEVTLTVKADA